MKTAMQELLEAYDECKTLHDFNDWLCNNEKTLLEKEKEQIMTAFYADDDTGKCKYEDSEDYYNQTYQKD